MADDLPPPRPILQADQFPVCGDQMLLRVEFRSLHRGGCAVKIRAPSGGWHIITVDGADILCPLRVGHVLESYGQ
jgi:hypothetical protein